MTPAVTITTNDLLFWLIAVLLVVAVIWLIRFLAGRA